MTNDERRASVVGRSSMSEIASRPLYFVRQKLFMAQVLAIDTPMPRVDHHPQ
jgi:hypothetical protein